MSEYCEYMWSPTTDRARMALAQSLYQDEAKLDARDEKLAIKTVRAILRDTPGVDMKLCTDEYVTRFLLARKYRTEQAADLIVAYQTQLAHRRDIFGNLTARDPAIQRALRGGIPGVLPARDRKGRCILIIMASQWDPVAVPALAVQRAIFLVLEILIQDPRNQHSGFVAVIDWSDFSLRQGGSLGAAALRNLIAALRGRFPARFKAVHFLSAPLYVQATLTLIKPFLDEKTRNKIHLHGNNLSTLHDHLPADILPAELGGTGPAFNPGLWAEPVIQAAMREAAEQAALKKEKRATVAEEKPKSEEPAVEKASRVFVEPGSEAVALVELKETSRKDEESLRDDVTVNSPLSEANLSAEESSKEAETPTAPRSRANSSEFEMIPSRPSSEDGSQDAVQIVEAKGKPEDVQLGVTIT